MPVQMLQLVRHFSMYAPSYCYAVTLLNFFRKGGWWGPIYSGTLTADDAQDCGYQFDLTRHIF